MSTVPSESRSPAVGDQRIQPVVNFGKFASVAWRPPAMNPCSALESPPSTISARPSPVMSTKSGAERKLRPLELGRETGQHRARRGVPRAFLVEDRLPGTCGQQGADDRGRTGPRLGVAEHAAEPA